MNNFKKFMKGFGTSFTDGEKILLGGDQTIANQEELSAEPMTTAGWYVRCYVDGAIFGLAILGLIAKINGYFKEDKE